ncbi:MAG: AAA family ATPase [Megasphaera micronuciformis]|jgi:possible AAA family ATPase
MNKYSKKLLDTAIELDRIIKANGEINKSVNELVADHNNKIILIKILKIVSDIIEGINFNKEVKQLAQIMHSNLLSYYGYLSVRSLCKDSLEPDDSKSLTELLLDLNKLIGLESVKEKVQDLMAYQKVQKMRMNNNLHSQKNTLHLAFTGNPGTGKTTVARIVGRIYKKLGLLSQGHFIEVSRTDLIAGYQGQTALKVKSVIERAKGGVLFIDEAYSITENEQSDSYGKECLTELTKALEDYREDLVVIVAGYTKPMYQFFESNPGLKSRFNTFIEFDDYDADELLEILLSICLSNDYILTEDLKKKVYFYFVEQLDKKADDFANGRFVRNIYDDLVMNHARRTAKLNKPTKEDLSIIILEDFKV